MPPVFYCCNNCYCRFFLSDTDEAQCPKCRTSSSVEEESYSDVYIDYPWSRDSSTSRLRVRPFYRCQNCEHRFFLHDQATADTCPKCSTGGSIEDENYDDFFIVTPKYTSLCTSYNELNPSYGDFMNEVTVSKEEEEEEVRCSFCFEELKAGTAVSKLPCNHIFHGSCIRAWLICNKYCPVCRSQLPTNW